MEHLFQLLRTPGGRRILFISAAIFIPVILAATLFLSFSEDEAAASGTPNDFGGVHVRMKDKDGVTRALPAALVPFLGEDSRRKVVDLFLDTDGAGRIVRASVTAFTDEPFAAVAARHQTLWSVPASAISVDSVDGTAQGYKLLLARSSRGSNDPFPGLDRLEYSINPVKP